MTPVVRPLIGITGYVEPARYLAWDHRVSLIPHGYVGHVARAGGQPVVLPPAGTPAAVVNRLDGLVLSGGGDIDPVRYGCASRHPKTGYVREFRDDAEFAIAAAAVGSGLPVLGICRGLQVLNVLRGGTLHQHLPDVVGHGGHAPSPGVFGRVGVRLGPESGVAKAAGATELTPSHYHHQAVDRLGDGLAAAGWAEDGTVEAVELIDHPFVLAVQWHPEVDSDGALFEALIDAATPTP